MLSAIQMVNHTFIKVEVNPAPGFDINNKLEQVNVQISTTNLDHHKNGLWGLGMQVLFGRPEEGGNTRYEGCIRVQGFFRVDPKCSAKTRNGLLRMNGGSLLLGAVREMISLITSRCNRGTLEIATFDARMFLEEEDTAEEKPMRTTRSLPHKKAASLRI